MGELVFESEVKTEMKTERERGFIQLGPWMAEKLQQKRWMKDRDLFA